MLSFDKRVFVGMCPVSRCATVSVSPFHFLFNFLTCAQSKLPTEMYCLCLGCSPCIGFEPVSPNSVDS